MRPALEDANGRKQNPVKAGEKMSGHWELAWHKGDKTTTDETFSLGPTTYCCANHF